MKLGVEAMNNTRTYRGNERCKSFISTSDRAKAMVQKDEESIWLDLPGASLRAKAGRRARTTVREALERQRSFKRPQTGWIQPPL